ncbi:hypothetical protein EK0264_08635 [Epidermidibacterium keratini]|uniref:Uncharacterized protein n=1 Tax=Epidermidibacterium keratini TaxID=1891644 RepID=A0A7L4YMH0_9ACTN|nr:hypothetical protein [Epidermidibacterium keratini]QHC00340.1 hypothetical protein EK0264_08635 [Epidermidibacterium keratini]
MAEPTGVVVPAVSESGRRSTSALGRAVVAGALTATDPAGARAAQRETDWRRGYPVHFKRMVEVGFDDEAAAVRIARDGLASLHDQMRYRDSADADAADVPLGEVFDNEVSDPLVTSLVEGRNQPEAEFSLPYKGERLRGDGVRRQLDAWVREGAMEPSAADAVREVLDHPEWLALPGRTMVTLGATAEMGPLQALLRWGATVAAVDLPQPEIWRRLVDLARSSGGRLMVPTHSEGLLVERAGADLLHDLPTVAEWVRGLRGPLVLGNYVYADGEANLRVSTAVDALTAHVAGARDDLALAFLATPTDVYGVPAEAVTFSAQSYDSGRVARLVRPAVRTISGGRLLKRNYAPGSNPGLADSMVLQQGPNYILAKRLQRWRATAARRDGLEVSLNVAPPTRTRSVMKNRALAAAYAGAYRFGVDVFSPATSNTLMAALLVHDLNAGTGPLRDPWREEADKAVHGGLWRGPYEPRSALGIAVVLGMGRAKS